MANKSHVVTRVMENTGVDNATATKMVNETFNAVDEIIIEEGKLVIMNHGAYEIKYRAARKGRNPQDGTELPIKAKNLVTFVPGKALVDKTPAPE